MNQEPVCELSHLEPVLVESIHGIVHGHSNIDPMPAAASGCMFTRELLADIAAPLVAYRALVIAPWGVPRTQFVFRRCHAPKVRRMVSASDQRSAGWMHKYLVRIAPQLLEFLDEQLEPPFGMPTIGCDFKHSPRNLTRMLILAGYVEAWCELWSEQIRRANPT